MMNKLMIPDFIRIMENLSDFKSVSVNYFDAGKKFHAETVNRWDVYRHMDDDDNATLVDWLAVYFKGYEVTNCRLLTDDEGDIMAVLDLYNDHLELTGIREEEE